MIAEGWQPVALSRDIAAGTSAGTVLQDREIVLWRDVKGGIHAWDDRCPHRGMKLSFGFVRGDHIACLYHGWEYAADGRCRRIPAHPALDVPASIRVPTYGVGESGGMVMVSFDSAPPPLPPGEGFVALRSLFLDCPPDDVINLFGSPGNPFGHISCDGHFGTGGNGTALRLGLQRCGAGQTHLHITVGEGTTLAEKIALMDKAVAFRSLAERVTA